MEAMVDAGYDVSLIEDVVYSVMPPGFRGMTLDSGMILSDEAFTSQSLLNHVVEEELRHLYQKAADPKRSFGPNTARMLEIFANVDRAFPYPDD